ncbi:MAG: efflux RND transporter periplasmic adaptor subunit [Proteobacteria bacterium]|nr:efflux RND transporter periplasmic adaptor subunit [Pseudomonadota bacterium]
MKSFPLKAALTAAIALGLSACNRATPPAAAPATEEKAAATESPRMDDAALKAAGIRLEAVQASQVSGSLRAPGEVLDSAYGTTLITPRVESLVIRRQAKLGDEVRAGAPLVTLASVQVSDAQADLRVAEQEYRRVAALGPEAVAGRRITEARVALDRARAKAQAYGLPGRASGTVNGQFTLFAPHAGRITEDDFVIGERVEPGKALYRLVDESKVWVDARLAPGTAPRIEPGRAATIVFNGRELAGTVLRSAHRTSDATRNATVRVEVPNRDDALHAGDFVEVVFRADGEDAVTNRTATELSVPVGAIVQLQGDSVVFRRDAKGVIEPVPVRTGETLGERTVIREGLKAGDLIVVDGAFKLKAQMLKSQLGEAE